MSYDVFISYRRDGGEQSAKAIYDRLRDNGYNVFLDVETLRSGAFNEKLYSVIEECKDVLVILSPHSLDRCTNEGDWVRLEISHAIKCKKNIIPIMLRDFTFPEKLPTDIDSLRYQHGLQASVEFFDAFLEKLYSFMKSKPGVIQRFLSNLSWRRSLIAVTCCVLLISGIWGGSIWLNQKVINPAAYPSTKSQKNDVKNMLHYIQTNITVLDTMYFNYETALKDCEAYLLNPNPSSYQNIVSQLKHSKETLKKLSEQAMPMSKELASAISNTNIDMGDLAVLYEMPKTFLIQYDESIAFLENSMDPNRPLDSAVRYKIVAINKDLLQLDTQSTLIGICDLLLPVDENALKDFRTEFLPSLGSISKHIQLWSKDETSLKSQEKNIATQQQNLMVEYASLVGDMNDTLAYEKEALATLLTQSGMTRVEAENYVNNILGKSQSLADKKNELELVQKELEDHQQLLREKFAPKDTDDPYLVWGKALRFLTVKMYDDAINAFQFYMNMVRNTDSEASVYVPAAINFVRNISLTGIDYGIIVTGYEPGKPKNPYYKTGDIIIAVNKIMCRNFEDFQKIIDSIPTGSSFTVTIMRSNGKGKLEIMDVNITPGQNKVALMNLTESE